VRIRNDNGTRSAKGSKSVLFTSGLNQDAVPASNVPSQKSERRSVRSKSNLSGKGKEGSEIKSLKLLGGQTIQLPTRERFNEDIDEVVDEIKDKQSVTKNSLTAGNVH